MTTISGARRLFVGVGLPVELQGRIGERVAAVQRDLPEARARGLRWVRAEKLHLTLKFLGDVPQERIPRVLGAMSKATSRVDSGAKPIRIRSSGVFPSLRRPRVLWLGVEDPTSALSRMAGALDAELESLDFPRQDRPFVAHLTLARLERPLPPDVLARFADADFGEFRVESVILFESLLRPDAGRAAGYHVLGEAFVG